MYRLSFLALPFLLVACSGPGASSALQSCASPDIVDLRPERAPDQTARPIGGADAVRDRVRRRHSGLSPAGVAPRTPPSVTVVALVDASGAVVCTDVADPQGEPHEDAARRAVAASPFLPATLDGEPVMALVSVAVNLLGRGVPTVVRDVAP